MFCNTNRPGTETQEQRLWVEAAKMLKIYILGILPTLLWA